MSESDIPVIKVLIKPSFDSAHNITTLSISLTKEFTKVESDGGLSSSPDTKNTKRVLARDEEGSTELAVTSCKLPVDHLAERGIRWVGNDFILSDDETPKGWKLSYEFSPGPLFDLHCDQGGALGACLSSLPELQTNQIYRNIVEWDLSEAPEGTRAVWTFGEGPSPMEKVGPALLLSDSVYMVGQIHSNPPAPIPGTISDYYGYYWFGTLPPNIAVIKDIHHDFFTKVSTFFSDAPSATNPYRSFVLRTTPNPSFGGTNFLRSHIFSYDDQISLAHDYDLIRRMAYEMVHNFLGPSPTDPSIDWLFEGIKNTLSVYLPFRTGFRTPDYFQATMAMQCLKYYTNPLIHLSHDEALSLAPTNEYARELISARAWAFVILTDFRTRVVAEEKRKDLMPRPTEDMAIKPLDMKKRNGEPHGIEQWIVLLEPLMGNEVRELYEQMKSGAKIMLPEKFFGPKTHRMARVKMEMLDFGMERSSFETGVVRGLKMGSRAQMAGLVEGDRIVRTSTVWRCVDHFEADMEVFVLREEVEVIVRYWPRSTEKVECLKFVKLEEEIQ